MTSERQFQGFAREPWLRLSDVRLAMRRLTGSVRVETMKEGLGAGALFSPGPSNPEYGVGSNELPVQEAVAKIVKPGMMFFDIGSNVGFFSIIASKLVGPKGLVVAFEPVPDNAAQVRFNAKLNGMANIRVIEKAVSESTGRSTLLVARYSGGAALEVAGAPPDFWKARQTDVISLDDAVGSGALPVPHVLKVDVEGAEIQVLRGAKEVLKKHKPVVVFEIDGPDLATVTKNKDQCNAFLASLGYELEELPDAYAGINWVVRHVVATPKTA